MSIQGLLTNLEREHKKSNKPNLSMNKSFNKIQKTLPNVSKGAIVCSKDELSMLDSDTFVIPYLDALSSLYVTHMRFS